MVTTLRYFAREDDSKEDMQDRPKYLISTAEKKHEFIQIKNRGMVEDMKNEHRFLAIYFMNRKPMGWEGPTGDLFMPKEWEEHIKKSKMDTFYTEYLFMCAGQTTLRVNKVIKTKEADLIRGKIPDPFTQTGLHPKEMVKEYSVYWEGLKIETIKQEVIQFRKTLKNECRMHVSGIWVSKAQEPWEYYCSWTTRQNHTDTKYGCGFSFSRQKILFVGVRFLKTYPLPWKATRQVSPEMKMWRYQ